MLQQGLAGAVDATAFGAKSVSESFGRQIANNALLAILVSLLLIVAYISVRFEWKYSVGVLVALAHDVIITVGIYALTGREVSTATVAAVLTVLGYSIYDTIIVFDRIRENVPLMRRASFRVIGNVSMWEVLPRSLATTFITLLPVAALYVFGGDTLKDFAFALLVGIGSGAYSSVFLAAPLLASLKEREPEFQRRRDDLGALEGIATVGGTFSTSVPRTTPTAREVSRSHRRAGQHRLQLQPLRPRASPARRRRSASGGGNDAPRGRMADPANDRSTMETVTLAGLGAIALAAERADRLAEDLASAGRRAGRGARGHNGRPRQLAARSRPARRIDGKRRFTPRGDLGIASAQAVDDLSLRVAQLEHRLKLLERASPR